MHPNVLAQRNAVALNRMGVAAAALAERWGVPPPALTHPTHDPAAAALFRLEALADFLEGGLLTLDSAPNSEQLPVEITSATDDRSVAALLIAMGDMDLDDLNKLEAAEQFGRKRKGVLEAIAARREVLQANLADTPPVGAAV